MNLGEYKVRIRDTRIMRMTALKASLDVLQRIDAPEAKIIEEAIKIGGLEKPAKHDSPSGIDYYFVKYTEEEADNIVGHMLDARGFCCSEFWRNESGGFEAWKLSGYLE